MDTVTSNASTPVVSPNETTSPPSGGSGATVTALPGKARIAIGFLLADTDPQLIVDSDRILIAMPGNKSYLTPSPTLAEVTTARNDYIAAVNTARDSRIAIALRKQKRAVLVALLRQLAHYVQVASGGDPYTLQSSGFPVQRSGRPIGPLPAPADLRLSAGAISGQIVARCRKQERAGAYQWRCAPIATPSAWLPVLTTLSAKASFDGLSRGMEYVVQVCVIGTAGASNWSDAATLMVV